MKKLLFLLAAVGMIFTACEGGESIEEANGGAPFVPEITISPDELSFPVEGGEQEVAITANFEYKVSEKADWLSVEQTETGLLVTAKESKNTSERNAYIYIINEKYSITKTIDIVQEAWVPKIELAQQSVEVEFEPAQYTVAVTSPYSWEATTKNDWIVVESETGIAGEEKLKFTTLRNEEEKERKGTITLKNTDYNLVAELYITQKAFVPAITIEPGTLTFAVEGGTQEIAITANFEYAYSSNADWLTIKTSEKGVSVTVPNYVEVEERTAEITISNEKYGISKVVKVAQGAFVPAITIEPESLTFTFEGGTKEVAITANFEYEYSTNADWLTIKKSEKGISVTVPNYVEVDERTAEITISNKKYGISKVVKATQGAFVPEWTIEPESLTFAVEGGTQEIAITANFEEYKYSTNADWLTIEKSEKGVNITATPNTKFEECTAEITISSEKYGISKAITIMQQGVSAESQNVIIYTSSDGKIVTPYKSGVFGANIVSNTYRDGQGLIIFDAPVTSIGDNAFEDCTSLRSVTIPDSVTKIGERAFYNCDSLTSVTIPDSVTKIGDYAFRSCTWLTSVTIGNSVTSIGSSAFHNCTKLTSITIPDSVTSIGDWAFYNCTSLTSATIGNGVTSIGEDAFYGCTKLTSVTIGNSVTSIGGNAFRGCSSLTSVTIPDNVTSIGNYAFSECSSLKSVTIGNSVTSIGDFAFSYCATLTSVAIGNSVTSIGDYAFYNCTSLTAFYGKFASTDNRCLIIDGVLNYFAPAGLTEYTIPDSVTSIGRNAFRGCSSLTSVTIPDSVTEIGYNAFNGCTGELIINSKIVETDYTYDNYPANYNNNGWLYGAEFTKVTIGNGVTKIGDKAFQNCTSLTSVTIPNSVTSIGEYAFSDCTKLKSITIGNSVTKIGSWAFYDCTSLTSITIPDSVTSIGDSAFRDCTSLTSVYCKPTTPPTGGSQMFSYDSNYSLYPIGCKIYVPIGSGEAYKAKRYWSDYADYIEEKEF